MDLVGGGDAVRKVFRFGCRLGLRALDGKAGLGRGWGNMSQIPCSEKSIS